MYSQNHFVKASIIIHNNYMFTDMEVLAASSLLKDGEWTGTLIWPVVKII